MESSNGSWNHSWGPSRRTAAASPEAPQVGEREEDAPWLFSLPPDSSWHREGWAPTDLGEDRESIGGKRPRPAQVGTSVRPINTEMQTNQATCTGSS